MRLLLDRNPVWTNLATICGGAVVGTTILLASNHPGATLVGSMAGSVAGSMAGQAYAWRKHDNGDEDFGYPTMPSVPVAVSPSPTKPQPTKPLITQPIEANHSAVERGLGDRVQSSTSNAVDIPPALDRWLSDRKIRVQHSHAATDSDLVYDRLARRLGEDYIEEQGGYILRTFMSRLRWAITHDRPGTKFQLRDANQTQTRVLTSIARELGRSSLFSNYFYVKDQKVLNIGLSNQVEAQEFLLGGWFERFIFQEVEALLTQAELSFEVLKNPHVQFPNQDVFELDLLFSIEGKPVLIECKTGKNSNYLNRHLDKFSSHCRKLEIESDRAFLIVLDLDPAQEQDLAHLWPFQFASQTSFIPKLGLALGL
ncbi:MAG: hypothetical protein AB4050_05750 [Synechococcus sp.]